MKLGSILILVLSTFAIGFLTHRGISRNSSPEGLWWNAYVAREGDWKIVINESQDTGFAPRRLLHITDTNDSLVGISGHDYDMDGAWDRVFFVGYDREHIGANSFLRTKKGWKWEPCPGDKDSAPIPTSEIEPAIRRLDSAMKYRRLENIVTLWTYHSTTNFSKAGSRL